MHDVQKSREELLEEIGKLQSRISHLEDSESRHQKAFFALSEAEEKYRLVVQNATEGILVVQDGVFKFVNTSALKFAGSTEEELASRSFLEFIHPDDRAMVMERHLRRLRGEQLPDRYPLRFVNVSGKDGWIELNAVPITWQGRPATLNFLTDITERKRAEEELRRSENKLRFLSAKLFNAQEKERSRLARELHDELGQSLASLKIKIGSIEKRLREDQPELRKECQDTRSYLDEVIDNVRRLSRELSPTILEDLGLSAALRWLAENYAQQNSTHITLDVMDIDHLISKEGQVNIYRFCQEALNNAGKHSQATQILLRLAEQEKLLSFRVRDNGKGFDVEQVMAKSPHERGMGLATMDERAHMLGATFKIQSSPGQGTEASLIIPIKQWISRT